jgi:hypothetical protein
MFSDAKVKEMRKAAAAAPPPPTLSRQAELVKIDVGDGHAPQPKPRWLGAMCWLRAHFLNTALVVRGDSGPAYFKFMYATQSPLFACFASLQRQDQFLGAEVITGMNWEEVAANTHEFEFLVGFDAIVPWDSLPRVDEDRMRVITGLFYTGGNALVSDSPSVPLAAYLDTLPPLKEGADALGRAQTGKLRQDERRGFVEEHPFLEHFLTHDAQPTKRDGARWARVLCPTRRRRR